MPYGEVKEKDTFARAVHSIPDEVLNKITEEAGEYAEQDREWAGWIVRDGDGEYWHHPLVFESSAASVRAELPSLPDGVHLVLDIHSHGRMEPFFSSTDDADDRGGVRVCAVLGGYEGPDTFSACFRYVVEGFFIDKGVEL